jgi:hypothetical protein
MMEAERTSETSVYSDEAIERYIPEGSNLHTRRRENLKSHIMHTTYSSGKKICAKRSIGGKNPA